MVAAGVAALRAGGTDLLGGGGPAATQRLGGLLAGLGDDGLDPTLERLGLTRLIGLRGEALLIELVNFVSGDEAGFEATAVRSATDEIIAAVVEALEDDDTEWDESRIERLLERFWSRYISSLITQALSASLMTAAPGEEAARLVREIDDHVVALLEHHLDGRPLLDVDWLGSEGAELSERIRVEVLEVVVGAETATT